MQKYINYFGTRVVFTHMNMYIDPSSNINSAFLSFISPNITIYTTVPEKNGSPGKLCTSSLGPYFLSDQVLGDRRAKQRFFSPEVCKHEKVILKEFSV